MEELGKWGGSEFCPQGCVLALLTRGQVARAILPKAGKQTVRSMSETRSNMLKIRKNTVRRKGREEREPLIPLAKQRYAEVKGMRNASHAARERQKRKGKDTGRSQEEHGKKKGERRTRATDAIDEAEACGRDGDEERMPCSTREARSTGKRSFAKYVVP